MTVRKKKTTRRKAQKKESNGFALFALLALVGIALAGWYLSLSGKTTLSSTKMHTVVAKPKPRPINKQKVNVVVAPLQRATQPTRQLVQTKALRPPLPVLSLPESQSTQQPKQKPTSTSRQVSPLNKTRENLPPKGKFNIQNAANVIFARKQMVIYTKADSNGPKVATVKRGQEMRSYGKKGIWHRVTIPRTGIIGWAKADLLTQSKFIAHFGIDGISTGSIAR